MADQDRYFLELTANYTSGRLHTTIADCLNEADQNWYNVTLVYVQPTTTLHYAVVIEVSHHR